MANQSLPSPRLGHPATASIAKGCGGEALHATVCLRPCRPSSDSLLRVPKAARTE